MKDSLVAGIYEKVVDRYSAYEKLTGRVAGSATPAAPATPDAGPAGNAPIGGAQQPAQQGSEDGGILGGLKDIFLGTTGPITGFVLTGEPIELAPKSKKKGVSRKKTTDGGGAGTGGGDAGTTGGAKAGGKK